MIAVRILQIIFGLAMLFLGRRLFWLFVGALGFVTATELAVVNLASQPEWMIVLLGLAAGVVGALLAIFFQAGAIGLAGLLAGGHLGFVFSRSLDITNQTGLLVAYIVGAVIGLLLFILMFDGALIAISSIIGAYILIDQVELTGPIFWVVFVVFAFLGVWVQINQLNQEESKEVAA